MVGWSATDGVVLSTFVCLNIIWTSYQALVTQTHYTVKSIMYCLTDHQSLQDIMVTVYLHAWVYARENVREMYALKD